MRLCALSTHIHIAMKYVNSGEGKMPLISLLAILSISLTINLPGLAVSPMLGTLRHVFGSTELEAQLLTSLPNLVMIPFVVIAGKLATPRRSTAILTTGLVIFFISGIVSLFADSMGLLIAMGCLGGVGCALVVPIAAGYISEWFTKRPRQSDLGLKATASNIIVIIANIYVGWVVVKNWHAAFAVYLVPVIPFLLVPFMTQKYIRKNRILTSKPQPEAPDAAADSTDPDNALPAYHFQGSESLRMLVAIIVLYVLLTYSTTSISYYAPFMMEHYNMGTTEVGIVTAAYYAMIAVSSAFVGRLKRFFGKTVMFSMLAVCSAGLIVIGLAHNFWIFTLSSLCIGFAYGIIEPIIYNKTTYIAPSQKQGMTYFGYVLSSNYLSIMMVPFVDSFFRKIFHSDSPGFEFVFSGVVVAILLIWALFERKNYVFAVNPASAAPAPNEVAAAIAAERELARKTGKPLPAGAVAYNSEFDTETSQIQLPGVSGQTGVPASLQAARRDADRARNAAIEAEEAAARAEEAAAKAAKLEADAALKQADADTQRAKSLESETGVPSAGKPDPVSPGGNPQNPTTEK